MMFLKFATVSFPPQTLAIDESNSLAVITSQNKIVTKPIEKTDLQLSA
jgi:hypothetical protein